eukprot:COSAG01_NODE_190_length_22595_cov_16.442301_16_plen_85_part_00
MAEAARAAAEQHAADSEAARRGEQAQREAVEKTQVSAQFVDQKGVQCLTPAALCPHLRRELRWVAVAVVPRCAVAGRHAGSVDR